MAQRIAILATGNELIEGKTINTNASSIAQSLFSEGLEVGLQMVCGDEEDEIVHCLTHLSQTHDQIIIIGGLGPTSDDKTRFALAKFLKLPLIPHETALKHISKLSRREQLHPGDKQQALFPKEATLLSNPFGTALGCFIHINDLQLYMLPGPPRECLPMFQEEILPGLMRNTSTSLCHLSWLVFAQREEYIARTLEEALSNFKEYETGYRLDPPYVECKIRCKNEDRENIESRVDQLLAPYILISSEQKASQMLIAHLEKYPKTYRIRDQATAGTLQRLMSTFITHPYLIFTQSDLHPVDFECKGLDTFWKQTNGLDNQIVFKSYLNDKRREKRSTFSFQSKLVLDLAAEWVCAQIYACLTPDIE